MSTNTKVFVAGHFNVLHPGHLRLLRFARELGNELIVGVYSDELAGGSAYVLQDLRIQAVKTNSWVHDVVVIDRPVTEIIGDLKPDYVVKGKEHEHRVNPELKIVESYGGKLVFSSGEALFSSVDLIRRSTDEGQRRETIFPESYARRHEITPSRLVTYLKKFSRLKVCVVGDLIVDDYISCDPLGMSREDPTIVVAPIDRQRFIGGAGIVAAHSAGLGAVTHFVSMIGKDKPGDYARNAVQKYGVDAQLVVDESRPTTLKERYRADSKTLFRVNYLHQESISSECQAQILRAIEKVIPECQVLIFSDFSYGLLTTDIVQQVTALGKKYGALIVADSQSSSQIGDIGRFVEIDLVTPTEREARLALSNRDDGLVVLVSKLRERIGVKHVILKLGAEGVFLDCDDGNQTLRTDRIPALNSNPRDVAGAGDSLLVLSSLTLASGGSPWEASCLGAIAAGIQISRTGNIPLTISDFTKELDQR